MKRKKRILIQPKIVFRICFIFCIILIFLSFRYQEKFSPVKTAVGDFITPMQKGINTLGGYISDKFQVFRDRNSLIKENQSLKSEIDNLKIQNRYLTSDMYEWMHFRELYQVGETYADYEKVAARVISKEPNSYYNIFTIDKGKNDGILVDMNVLAGNGLCGIVIEVGLNYAKVRSIIDDASYVSGMFLKTSDTCDVKGDLELLDSGYIQVEAISINADVKDNDEVVTSHISDKYLQGLLIGYVTQIEADSSSMTKKAYLKPVVDFEHIEDVLVITELKKPLQGLPDENSYDTLLERAGRLSLEQKKNMLNDLSELMNEEETVDDDSTNIEERD